MKFFPLLYFIFLLNINLLAQNKEQIKSTIRIKVKAINKGKIYKKVELSQENFMDHATDRGATLTGYFKKGELVKIVSWIGLSNYYAVDEYFLENGKLMFVHEEENQFEYKDTIGFDEKTFVRFEGRYWFDKNKKIDQVSSGNDRFKDRGIDPEKEFTVDVKKYIPLLYKKYKSGKN